MAQPNEGRVATPTVYRYVPDRWGNNQLVAEPLEGAHNRLESTVIRTWSELILPKESIWANLLDAVVLYSSSAVFTSVTSFLLTTPLWYLSVLLLTVVISSFVYYSFVVLSHRHLGKFWMLYRLFVILAGAVGLYV